MPHSFIARCAIAALLGVGVPAVAAAQAAPQNPAPTASPVAEIGRVVTSDRQDEPIGRTSRPTFVVDRASIEARGARTIADALAVVPGFDSYSYGSFGAQADYGIRGTTSAQTLILRDGTPIATGSSGTIDLGTLSTVGVKRIEVVESGSSTLYGTSAAGGVINIITGGAAQPLLRASTGSFGENDVAADAAAHGFSVAYERHTANGGYAYPALAYAPSAPQAAGVRTNADAQQTVARVAYTTDLAGVSARFSAGLDAIRIGVPGSTGYITPNARQGTTRNDAQVDLAREVGPGTLSVTLSGSTHRLAYADPDNGGEQDTYDARSQASLKYAAAGGPFDLVAGLDASRESAFLTLGSFGPPPAFTASESQTAGYAQLGFRAIPTVRTVIGLRAENDAPLGRTLAPSVGFSAALGAANLSANLGQSFRVPTLIDLYYPGYSNPSLKPEKLAVYDVTLAFPTVAGGISFGYFGRNGANIITLDPTTFAPFNAARASVNGFQATLATKPRNHVHFTASATDLYKSLDTATGLRLPRSPVVTGTVGAERPFDGGPLAYGANFHIVGSTPNNGPAGALAEDSATLADVYVRYRVLREAIATFRVRNLGDQRYAPVYRYPAPGRAITFELSTR